MLPLAITCGDPAGVGPEIIEAWLREQPAHSRGDTCVIGPEKWLRRIADVAPRVFAVGDANFEAVPGEPSTGGASIATAAMMEAATGCRERRYSAVVTGPVSKGWLQKAGYPFPGQTEFFAYRWGGAPSMAFVGDKLRLVLATWHIPLQDVPAAITRDTVSMAVERAAWLAGSLGADQPRIAVCGLNPHAGEGGVLGGEERDVIDPLLDTLRESLPGLSRCLPGDTVFMRMLRGEFDVAVAMYHDQGLAAIKTLEFDTAVNVTLGLPHIRTSPDHGTGFDIAGTGKASHSSFGKAVELARKLAVTMQDASTQ